MLLILDAMVRYRLSMNSVRSRAMNVSQSPVVGEFENMLPLYFVKASGTSVDRARSAIRRHFKTGPDPDTTSQTRAPHCGVRRIPQLVLQVLGGDYIFQYRYDGALLVILRVFHAREAR
jgi:hypothetical protein